MKTKKLIALIAIVLVVAITVGIVCMVVIEPDNSHSSEGVGQSATHDELFVRELLDGCDISTIMEDPDWDADVVDSTANYIMVAADKFDFSKQIGVENGYTNIYYDAESKQINMLQHNYVTYTNDLDPKAELQSLIGNVQGNISDALGNPSVSFMLINTQGETQDYDGLSIDEMIDKLLEGGHVMYVMYESNGLRYEMNIMFSDDTIYSMVWIYDDSHMHGDDCEH